MLHASLINACSTADCCPFLSIVVIHCGYHRLPLLRSPLCGANNNILILIPSKNRNLLRQCNGGCVEGVGRFRGGQQFGRRAHRGGGAANPGWLTLGWGTLGIFLLCFTSTTALGIPPPLQLNAMLPSNECGNLIMGEGWNSNSFRGLQRTNIGGVQ